MAIRKRGDSWQIDYLDPTGKRVRKSFKKKKDAVAELGKRVSLIAEGRYLDLKKDYKSTFAELLAKYKENFETQPSFANWKRFCLNNFRDHFGSDTLLGNIRYVQLETYRNQLKQKLTRHRGIRTDAAVNREIGVLRHMFSKAVEWEMVEKSPFKMGKPLQVKEDNQRIRYLEENEVMRLLEACKSHKHLYRIVVCALNTGMRRGEILPLRWKQVRNGFIYLEKTKTKNRREIPINADLSQVLDQIRREHVKREKNFPNNEYVFLYGSRKIKRLDRAFQGALKNAQIEDFRFHDLRHCFASHLVMRGASLKEVQELLGHQTMTMTLRYAHLSQENKKKAVNLLNGLTAPVEKDECHKTVTFPNAAFSPASQVPEITGRGERI
jgi:integrase